MPLKPYNRGKSETMKNMIKKSFVFEGKLGTFKGRLKVAVNKGNWVDSGKLVVGWGGRVIIRKSYSGRGIELSIDHVQELKYWKILSPMENSNFAHPTDLERKF